MKRSARRRGDQRFVGPEKNYPEMIFRLVADSAAVVVDGTCSLGELNRGLFVEKERKMAGIEREEKRIRKKTLKGKVILETGQVIFETIHTLLQMTNPALDSLDGTPVFLTRLYFRMVRLLLSWR